MRAPIALAVALLATLAAGAAHAGDKKSRKGPAAPPSGPTPAAAAPVDPKALVSLIVVCATPGAIIYVDGEQLAMTPMDLPVPVTTGDHSIKITRLGFAPYIDVFSTKGKREVKVEVELIPVSGVLHVKSNIPGARVLVDGKYMGEVGDAPLDTEVDVGPRAVEVSKVCFKPFFKNVMAVAGQDQTVEVALEDLPIADNPCKPLPPEAPKWYKKPGLWLGIAAGVLAVGGGVAAGTYFGTLDPLRDADMKFTATGLSAPPIGLANW